MSLLYADDVVLSADNAVDLELVIRIVEEITQTYGIITSIRKTRITPMKQMEDASRKIAKGKEVQTLPLNINIHSENIKTVDEFCCLGCHFTRDCSAERGIDARLSKASIAFNVLWHVVMVQKNSFHNSTSPHLSIMCSPSASLR